MRRQGIAASGGVEEYRLLIGAPAGLGQEAVPGAVGHRGAICLMALGAARPATLGEHHSDRLGGHQVIFRQRPRFLSLNQRRAAIIAIGFRIGHQLVPDRLAQQLFTGENLLQFVPLGCQRILLAADLHFLQPRQLPQPGIQDVISLQLAQRKALHEHRLGLILGANDLDHLIQIEESNQQTIQQVQARQDLVQTELQAAAHGGHAEAQPLADHRMQALHRRTAIGANHVHVDPIGIFQIGRGEQVLHQLIGVHPIGTRHYDNTGRVLVIGLIAQIRHQRQLPGLHLRSDLLQHLGAGHLMRQCSNDDIAVVP